MMIKDKTIQALSKNAKTHSNASFEKSNYYQKLQDNLVPTVNLQDFEQDFAQGSGNELHHKMRACHSSSMLAANTFGIFKKAQYLFQFQEQIYQTPQFEAKCPTGLKGTPPNLDVLFDNQNTVLAIESKLTEYLTPKIAEFSEKYKTHPFPNAEQMWLSIIGQVENKKYYFDVAQMIKHYLGLTNTYPHKKITLLYLYWQPQNADLFPVFQTHSQQIEAFAKKVQNSKVKFISITYPQLWQSWQNIPQLSTHLNHLKRKYQISI